MRTQDWDRDGSGNGGEQRADSSVDERGRKGVAEGRAEMMDDGGNGGFDNAQSAWQERNPAGHCADCCSQQGDFGVDVEAGCMAGRPERGGVCDDRGRGCASETEAPALWPDHRYRIRVPDVRCGASVRFCRSWSADTECASDDRDSFGARGASCQQCCAAERSEHDDGNDDEWPRCGQGEMSDRDHEDEIERGECVERSLREPFGESEREVCLPFGAAAVFEFAAGEGETFCR